MDNLNTEFELKFTSREIFSIMLTLQTILKLKPKDSDVLEVTKIIHGQLKTTMEDQVIKLDLYDATTLLSEFLLFNDHYLHSSFLNTLCIKIKDGLIAYITEEFLDDIELQILLKDSGIV